MDRCMCYKKNKGVSYLLVLHDISDNLDQQLEFLGLVGRLRTTTYSVLWKPKSAQVSPDLEASLRNGVG